MGKAPRSPRGDPARSSIPHPSEPPRGDAGKIRWPNASPHPVIPPSVSTRTRSISMLVRARPPSIGVAPSMTIGRLRTMVSIRVIFMPTCRG
jgi:hypothetical protein